MIHKLFGIPKENIVMVKNPYAPKEITEKLRSEILVKPKVELLEPGTLPVSEGKSVRVIDKRTL